MTLLSLSATRLTWRINRFEVRAIVIATIVATAVTAGVVNWMRSSGYVDCLVGGGSGFDGQPSVACLEILDSGMWFERIARASLGLVPVFPFLAGLLLGVPVVARELDRGTARLAWSLGPSRLRWYLQRLLPVLAAIAVTSLAIGIVAEWLVQLYAPGVDLANSFAGFHSRGVLVMTSALLLGAIGVLVGAILGRLLPAIFLALLLGGVTLVAVSEVHKQVLKPEAVAKPETAMFTENDLWMDGKFQHPDGRLMTWDELVAEDPTVMEQGVEYPYVQLVIPGERYRSVELREAAAHGVLIVGFLAGAGVVVARRRPG